MKRTRFAITLVACLLGLVGMAQNTVVEGTKLNIGENNTQLRFRLAERVHPVSVGFQGIL